MADRPKKNTSDQKIYRKYFTFEGHRYVVSGKTEKEAIENRAIKRHEMEEGRKQISRNMQVRDWARIYLETYKCSTISEDAYKALQSIQNKWVDPNIGGVALKSVRSVQCQAILNEMAAQRLSGKHIKRVKHHISGMFTKAIANGLLIDNPMDSVDMPQAKDGQHRAATPYERKLLLEVCASHKYGLWPLFRLYTGAGPKESARTLGRYLDFKNRRIWIDGVKSDTRPRWVSMPDVLYELLRNVKIEPFDYLFKNDYGRRVTVTQKSLFIVNTVP